MSLLANEFDVRSLLHVQVSLEIVNQIYVFHEAMKGCKKSKDSLKACFENVNIMGYTLDSESVCLHYFFSLSFKRYAAVTLNYRLPLHHQ